MSLEFSSQYFRSVPPNIPEGAQSPTSAHTGEETPKIAQEKTSIIKEKEQQIHHILNESIIDETSLTLQEAIEGGVAISKGLAAGEKGLSGALEFFGVYEGVKNGPALQAKEAVPVSLEVFGQAFESLNLVLKAGEYQDQGVEIEQKMSEVQQLNQERDLLKTANKDVKELDNKISSLEQQIEGLKQSRATFIKETAKFVTKSALSDVKGATEIGGAIAATGSHAAHILHTVGTSAAIGTGVVSGIVSAAALANDLKLESNVSSKFDELQRLFHEIDKDSPLGKIVEAKLHQLEQQSDNLCASSIRNYTGVISAALGTGASIGTIVTGAGVAVGAAGTAAIAASGIGAVAIGVTAVALGTAYTVYVNKDTIINAAETAHISVETPIQAMRYDSIRSDMKEDMSLRNQELKFLQETENRNKSINAYIEPIIQKINILSQEKAGIKEKIFTLEEKKETSIMNHLVSTAKIYSLEQDVKAIDQEIKTNRDHIRGIVDHEDTMQRISHRSIQKATGRLYEGLDSIQGIRERILTLKEETARVESEGHYIAWAKNIHGMDWKAVQELHSDLGKKLTTDPQVKEEVKNFLMSQGHSIEGFASDPATVILEYIAKETT